MVGGRGVEDSCGGTGSGISDVARWWRRMRGFSGEEESALLIGVGIDGRLCGNCEGGGGTMGISKGFSRIRLGE